MSRRRNRSRVHGEAHVRLYRHELDCPAYRTLSAGGRALLIELRALFDIKRGDNRVFLSIREIRKRCNLSQAAASTARDELIARGWIGLDEPGAFHRKVRHATVYTLENEPPNSGNGSVPSKAFMRWRPPHEQKNPVLESGTRRYSNLIPRVQKKAVTVLESDTENANFRPTSVLDPDTQISVTKRSAA
jgi:hypothetical protein